MAAGTSIPPAAAIPGNTALLTLRSSPATNSRLISIPTRKKNSAISPSLTIAWMGIARPGNGKELCTAVS